MAKLISSLKKFVVSNGLFKIQNRTLFDLNRSYKTYKRLEKKYASHIKKYEVENCKESNKVWFCWLQGIENAPELVKACYSNLKNILTDKEIIVITKENLKEYTNFPDFILEKWENGIISNTHFSDILRAELLVRNGGMWIDSTCLVTSKIPDYVQNSDFFVFNNEYRSDKAIAISSWFIYSKADYPILKSVLDLIFEYWSKKNKLEDYFLFHMFVTMVFKNYPELVQKIPFVSNINPHVLQFKYLFNNIKNVDKEFIKQTCFIHKLSYKFDSNLTTKENTVYQSILKGEF